MNTSVLISLILIGLLAGFFSGTLGIGGSVIMIPLLILWINFSQHEAQGTSLAVLAVPVTLLAAYNYYHEGFVNWKYAIVIAVTFIIGGYLGSKLAISINQELLKKIFGGVLLLVALKMIMGK
ncbi:putative membrane protein YfcA [Aquimarina sp. EL_43]|uniref:sulfite exporter TauE/SafE family protein n=1 Tax=unclassified Aquimarina TaxID=2627091 RepID=UPI0018CA6A5B|nr:MULTISPECIES: sulfite exporter TauE/SafE family protein [unclassified Aquimarina]MBG6130532.1 putative membrane protein YfcA [Aquimarina sp. EL_35]MBG6151322.1 putative membrane protein YfcA [Aquimarina sp. EL_32]MBG6168934.1 putative membrane protein YfcA [Aquimarina sp. EL_43]